MNQPTISARMPRSLLIGFVLLGAVGLGGCQPKILQHGNVPDEDQVVQIQPGIDDKNRVQQVLGSPSTTSTFGPVTWYYVSKKTSQIAFFEPRVVDQGVLAISFNPQGIVEDLKVYDQSDGRLVAMVDRTTPTHGNQLTIIQQLLGNIGRFNPETSRPNPAPSPTGTGGF
jgi:outer membrane protein assembly factor BamE (lipoprotein component of BamABCDE complex)